MQTLRCPEGTRRMQVPLLARTLICFLCGLALIVTLGACSKKDDAIIHETGKNDGGKVSLTFFGFKEEAMNLKAIEHAMQGYMDSHDDVNITYEGIKGTAYWDAFDKRDDAGVLDDVVMMHHDHVISLEQQGKLADLSDLPGIENFTDEARAQFTNPDGTVYFLPTQISTYNLYVNEDLLEENGLDVPGNWNEFQQVCDYFVSNGTVPIIANNRNSLTTVMLGKGLFDLYQQPDEKINATIESFNANPAQYADAVAPGVEQVAEMIGRGWIDPKEALATEQTSDDLELFLQGDRPFMLSGGWASARVMAKNPSFTYGVYAYPILDDGAVLPMQVDTCISVNANSSNVEQAKDFVSFLIQPDVMWEYCDGQASYTPLKDSRTPTEKTLAPSVDYLTNGRSVLRAEYRLTLPTEAALTAASKALLQGQSVEEAQQALLRELTK